jgi:hypothetical protein
MDGYEWDPDKAAANLAKHGVHFADAALSLEDRRLLLCLTRTPSAKSASSLWPLTQQAESWSPYSPTLERASASFLHVGRAGESANVIGDANAQAVRLF